MPQTNETLDITLLRTNKNAFILQCQRIIEIIAKHFIKNGMFGTDQFKDVVQSANEDLIKRLPIIEKNFNNKVLLTTYMNVVIRNIFLRIYERQQLEVATVPIENDVYQQKETHFNSLYIQDEIDRLGWIFQLYGTQRYKVIICLKIYFNIPITKTDILYCFKNNSQMERTLLFERFSRNYNNSLNSENFDSLAPIMNKRDNNSTSGNSLRRWTQDHLAKILRQLNGIPPTRTHTKETFKILLEQYSLKQ
jgi:hypothetical protein